MTDSEDLKRAIAAANKYQLGQDTDYGENEHSLIVEAAQAYLDVRPSITVNDAEYHEQVIRAVRALSYVQGIVERGEDRKLGERECLKQAFLNYVKKLEHGNREVVDTIQIIAVLEDVIVALGLSTPNERYGFCSDLLRKSGNSRHGQAIQNAKKLLARLIENQKNSEGK